MQYRREAYDGLLLGFPISSQPANNHYWKESELSRYVVLLVSGKFICSYWTQDSSVLILFDRPNARACLKRQN